MIARLFKAKKKTAVAIQIVHVDPNNKFSQDLDDCASYLSSTAPPSPCLHTAEQQHHHHQHEEEESIPPPWLLAKQVNSRLRSICANPELDYVFYIQKLILCSSNKLNDASYGVTVVALDLFERFIAQQCRNQFNVLLVLSASFLLAAKQLDDFILSTANSQWASICGHSVLELNAMELSLCQVLDWRVYTGLDRFESQKVKMEI